MQTSTMNTEPTIDVDTGMPDFFMGDMLEIPDDVHDSYVHGHGSYDLQPYGHGIVSMLDTPSSHVFDSDINHASVVQPRSGYDHQMMTKQVGLLEHVVYNHHECPVFTADPSFTLESHPNKSLQQVNTNANTVALQSPRELFHQPSYAASTQSMAFNSRDPKPVLPSAQSAVEARDETSPSQGSITSPGLPTTTLLTASTNVMISYLYGTPSLDDLVFKCSMPDCNDKSFKRCPDLTRHYNGAHTSEGKAYWCDVHKCERSNVASGRPFPRKDKLKDHKRQAHGV